VATRTVHASAGLVAVPIEDGAALEVLDVRGYDPSRVQAQQQLRAERVPVDDTPRTSQPVFVGSAEQIEAEFPELRSVLNESEFAAWAAIPLAVDRRSRGVLGLGFTTSRVLDPDERGFLLALAEVGSQALDRAHLHASEERARTEAEAAVRAQDEFLSVAAHELRTPVAAVKATAQLVERSMARGHMEPERLVGHLQRISAAADRLGALIEDLLDVSRLRTGRVRLRPEAFDLRHLVDEIVSRYTATETGHRFSLHAPHEPFVIQADPLRIEQVVENLLSNAVKYSPNGGPIALRLAPDGEGALLTVTDQGIGLPAGQEARIFEAFGRGSNATAEQIQGLGLGLAICRELVEVHGGRIWATSPGEGQGTTFAMWLPAVAPAQDDLTPPRG
jgi:signal transduction histidine kinase